MQDLIYNQALGFLSSPLGKTRSCADLLAGFGQLPVLAGLAAARLALEQPTFFQPLPLTNREGFSERSRQRLVLGDIGAGIIRIGPAFRLGGLGLGPIEKIRSLEPQLRLADRIAALIFRLAEDELEHLRALSPILAPNDLGGMAEAKRVAKDAALAVGEVVGFLLPSAVEDVPVAVHIALEAEGQHEVTRFSGAQDVNAKLFLGDFPEPSPARDLNGGIAAGEQLTLIKPQLDERHTLGHVDVDRVVSLAVERLVAKRPVLTLENRLHVDFHANLLVVGNCVRYWTQ